MKPVEPCLHLSRHTRTFEVCDDCDKNTFEAYNYNPGDLRQKVQDIMIRYNCSSRIETGKLCDELSVALGYPATFPLADGAEKCLHTGCGHLKTYHANKADGCLTVGCKCCVYSPAPIPVEQEKKCGGLCDVQDATACQYKRTGSTKCICPDHHAAVSEPPPAPQEKWFDVVVCKGCGKRGTSAVIHPQDGSVCSGFATPPPAPSAGKKAGRLTNETALPPAEICDGCGEVWLYKGEEVCDSCQFGRDLQASKRPLNPLNTIGGTIYVPCAFHSSGSVHPSDCECITCQRCGSPAPSAAPPVAERVRLHREYWFNTVTGWDACWCKGAPVLTLRPGVQLEHATFVPLAELEEAKRRLEEIEKADGEEGFCEAFVRTIGELTEAQATIARLQSELDEARDEKAQAVADWAIEVTVLREALEALARVDASVPCSDEKCICCSDVLAALNGGAR